MPVPNTTAMRSGSTPDSAPLASRQASSAAMTATCWLRSSRRARTRSSCSAGSLTSRATSWAGKSLIQSSVIRVTPDRPASSASQVLGTSPPRGVVAPSPVTTTSAVDVLMSSSWGLLAGRPGGWAVCCLPAGGGGAGGRGPAKGPPAAPRRGLGGGGGQGVLLLVLLD